MDSNISFSQSLYECILNRNIIEIETFLTMNDIDPNEIIPTKGMNILHLAVGIEPECSSEEITKLILNYGGDPNRRSEDGMTSIHVAAAWGRINILKLLLGQEGNQFLEDFEGKTALDYAVENEHTDVVDFLIKDSSQYHYGQHDTPDKFSFRLDKVIVKTDSVEAEYFPQNKGDEEVKPNRKSQYVNEWFDKNCTPRNNTREENLKNYRNDGIFSDKSISSDVFEDAVSDRSTDVLLKLDNISLFSTKSKRNNENQQSSNYDTCASMTDRESKFSPKESNNVIKFTQNISVNSTRSSGEECFVSGIESIAFTKTDDNDNFSVFLKQSKKSDPNTDSDDNFKIKTFVNYVFPDSPHQNYHSRSSIKSRRRCNEYYELKSEASDSESDFSDTSLDINADCSSVSSVVSSEFDKALLVSSDSDMFTEKSNSEEIWDIKDKNIQRNFNIEDFYDIEHKRDSKANCDKIDKVFKETAKHIPDRKTSSFSLKTSLPITNDTLLSVAEEYKYEDEQAGIVLVEKRILVNPVPITTECSDSSVALSAASSTSTLPQSLSYDTDTLRKELTSCGVHPGPITSSTKRVYLKRLTKLRKAPIIVTDTRNSKQKSYSIELEKTFRDPNWSLDLSLYIPLDRKVVEQFDEPDPNKRWREGIVKSSFTYLLLDPRITDNLPCKVDIVSKADAWRKFIDSIFYVGKGKRSRPYSHLYQAVALYNNGQVKSDDQKLQNIFDIWNNNTGVVCLHIFQNVIPVEAYTREAAMIEVLGLKNLRNVKPGNYYGVVSTWPLKQKKLLGVYLLYRAMLIFMNEGERQLRPADIG